MPNRIGVVIVSHGHENQISSLIESLSDELKKNDKLVLVDNHYLHKSAKQAAKYKRIDSILTIKNKGFANGCNIGANTIIDDVDALFFLNPDTKIEKNSLNRIRAEIDNYAVVMPLLLLPDGKINSRGNSVHLSGLSWCDGYGEDDYNLPKKLATYSVSGACMAVAKEWWIKLGGIDEDYFLYYEDTDFCTRALIAGGKLAVITGAKVTHEYDFAKGGHKWFYIERNRLLYILKCWPFSVILVLSPILIFSEIGLWFISIIQKRFKQKIKAMRSMIKLIPKFIRKRRELSILSKISTKEFLATLNPVMDSYFFNNANYLKPINYFNKLYVKLLLKIFKI